MQLKGIVEKFILIYNTQRYHGAIGYVIPEQKHNGEAKRTLNDRMVRKRRAWLRRLQINRQVEDGIE